MTSSSKERADVQFHSIQFTPGVREGGEDVEIHMDCVPQVPKLRSFKVEHGPVWQVLAVTVA